MLAAAAVLFVLHYRHLAADFPNHSPWMDWAKYTDEGWYGDAAIRHYDLGHWYVKGDFNPAAALPVWPLLEAVLFHFTGVSLVAARALSVSVFGLILVCAYALMSRALPGRRLGPAAAILLLAASPFVYAFSRMAVLEPLVVLLMLVALLVASEIDPEQHGNLRRFRAPAALGLLLAMMVLTKTTAMFLLPAVAWIVFERYRRQVRAAAQAGAVIAAVGLGAWLLYFCLLVRPHYLEDYRYLFSANAYTGITLQTAPLVLWMTLHDGLWIGSLLFPLAIAAGALALLWKPLRRNPVAVSLLLWALGYGAFLAYHNNLQPRYYLVVAVPLTLLVPLVLETVRSAAKTERLHGTAALLWLLPLGIAALDARHTLHYVQHPDYSFLAAAGQIRQVIEADHRHKPLLLSISGSDLTLMTGLPSICDDFGTMELEDRVNTYRPGWYASWNQVDDDKMDALTPLYHLERVAAFPAFDDPGRNLLILYRLDPAEGYKPPVRRRRRPLPKSLLSRLGQQPSAQQLQH